MLYFLWQIQNLANLFIVTNYSYLCLSFEFNSLNMTKNKSGPGNQILWILWFQNFSSFNFVYQLGFVIAVFYQEN